MGIKELREAIGLNSEAKVLAAVEALVVTNDAAAISSGIVALKRLRWMEPAPAVERLRRALNDIALSANAREAAERSQSVRERVFDAVATGSRQTSRIAEQLGLAQSQVSRALAELVEDSRLTISPHPTDGRGRIYQLADAAEDFSQIPLPGTQVSSSGVHTVTDAVQARRRGTALSTVLSMLAQIIRDGRTPVGERCQAVAELATTYRHDHRYELARLCAQWMQHRGIEHADATLVGKSLYEAGRCDVSEPSGLVKGPGTLHNALLLFQSNSSSPDLIGWTHLGLAEFYRRHRYLDEAGEHSTLAMTEFDRCENLYGAASSLSHRGFVRRLRGDFTDALNDLDTALDISAAEGHQRCLANTNLQLGETYRLLGAEYFDKSRHHLSAALAAFTARGGRSLGYTVGALGALEFDIAITEQGVVREAGLMRAAKELDRSRGMLHDVDGAAALMRRRVATALRELGYLEHAENEYTEALEATSVLAPDTIGKVTSLVGRALCRSAMTKTTEAVLDAIWAGGDCKVISDSGHSLGVASAWIAPTWHRFYERFSEFTEHRDLIAERLLGLDGTDRRMSEMGQESGMLLPLAA